MGWNHRGMRHPDGRLAVHEVFHDKAGRIDGFTMLDWDRSTSEFAAVLG